MKKHALILATGLLLLSPLSHAAKITSETVKTRYLHLPEASIDNIGGVGMSTQLAMKDVRVIDKSLATSTGDSACNYLKDKLGLKGDYKNHYYQITLSNPEPLVVVYDSNNKVIYASHVAPGLPLTDRFGTGCMSSQTSLDKALKENNKQYSVSAYSNKLKKATAKQVKGTLKKQLQPGYEKIKFKLFAAKDGDYADLQQALTLSLQAYSNMKERPYSEADKQNLLQAIDIWNKALEESDLNNKNARINKKLSERLHHNAAMNYLAIDDFTQAINHLRRIQEIWAGNSFSGFSVDPAKYIDIAKTRQRNYAHNPISAKNRQATVDKSAAIKSALKKLNVQIVQAQKHPEFLKIVNNHTRQNQEEKLDQTVKLANHTAASNPFTSKIQHTSLQGYTLFLTSFYADTYTEFPKQICELTQLNQVLISGNHIKTLPPQIGNLKNLKVLNLKSNQISALPAEIGGMTNLEKLILKGNQLNSLPPEISQLKKLKLLDIRKNQFTKEDIKRIKAMMPKKTKVKG